jgi:hypothetical protein
MSVSIKVKMTDSDEDHEITSGLKKGWFKWIKFSIQIQINKVTQKLTNLISY